MTHAQHARTGSTVAAAVATVGRGVHTTSAVLDEHPADPRLLTLRSDRWELDVLPATGAALAAGRIRTADGTWRDLLRPTPRTRLGDPEKCASFPMVPWSNRIRDGRLPFGGGTWQLQRNGADGTAIHGAVRYAEWTVVDRTAAAVELELDTSGLVGVNFPWRFVSRIRYALDGDALSVTTSIRNVDTTPFPAGFGHHPYLQRTLAPVASGHTPGLGGTPAALLGDGPVLDVPAHHGYALVDAMAAGPAGDVPRRADFRTPHPLGHAFIDDVLTDLEPGRPIRITYDDPAVTVDVEMDPVYSHLVLYSPRRRGYFAVEPVTNVNGGFALHEAGVPGTGVFVLAPGEDRTGTFTLRVTG
ncbi:aldose epimerase family protein [Cellulomonas soli]